MKVWEAIQMLEQMDQLKECTVTFGQAKLKLPLSGLPFTQDLLPHNSNWPKPLFHSKSANIN